MIKPPPLPPGIPIKLSYKKCKELQNNLLIAEFEQDVYMSVAEAIASCSVAGGSLAEYFINGLSQY